MVYQFPSIRSRNEVMGSSIIISLFSWVLICSSWVFSWILIGDSSLLSLFSFSFTYSIPNISISIFSVQAGIFSISKIFLNSFIFRGSHFISSFLKNFLILFFFLSSQLKYEIALLIFSSSSLLRNCRLFSQRLTIGISSWITFVSSFSFEQRVSYYVLV